MATYFCGWQVCSLVREIDSFTLLLLAGTYVMVGGVTEAGIIDDLSYLFVRIGQGNLLVVLTRIVWSTLLISALIPHVATMLPLVAGISSTLGIEPEFHHNVLHHNATLRFMDVSVAKYLSVDGLAESVTVRV